MISFKMALRSIGANKMRAVLTMLGIIIGVMALVVLVSLVNSATSSVTSAVSSLGSSLLTVTVSDDKGKSVKLSDLRAWVDEEDSVAAIAPYASAAATGKYALNNGGFTVYGTTPDYYEINGLQLSQGRFLKNADVDNANRVCVLDEKSAESLIGYTDCVGVVISLDGKMALDFPSAFPLAVGQSVTVTASDGTAYIGRVDSMPEGNVTVTITDDGPIVGDTASVTNADGAILGHGTLYVHSAWNVVAASGTVSYVNIREGRQIYSGTSLMSLKDMDHTAEYEKLAAQRRDYEEKLWELFILYQDGVIKAPCKGYVSGVDKNLVSQLAAAGGSHIVLLANAPDGGADGAFNRVGMVTAVNNDGTLTVRMQLADAYVEDYTDLSGISTESGTMTLEGKCAPGAAYSWTGEEWVASEINAGDVFVFAYDTLGNLLWMVYAGHNEVPSAPSPQPGADPGTLPDAVTSMPGRSGGSSGFSVRGSYAGAAQADESSLYDLDGTVICAVTPADTMTVSITVDELDILQYAIGMEAEITVDALPGQSFVGTVTQIGAIGSNSGGSSKYTVELTLDAAPNMLSGMNASVVVRKETVSALLLPSAALHDSGSKSYVYTAYDEKNDRLLAPAEVETGLSDGENVVILSGLTEGQIVWYSYFG